MLARRRAALGIDHAPHPARRRQARRLPAEAPLAGAGPRDVNRNLVRSSAVVLVNLTGVQRLTREGAQRSPRSSDCNPGSYGDTPGGDVPNKARHLLVM